MASEHNDKREERICSAEDCEVRHYAKGFCKKHYTQFRKHGRLTPELEKGAPRECQVEWCNRTDTINWYCRRHYRQIVLYGNVAREREYVTGRTGCKMEGCKRKHRARGYCGKHYNQVRYRMLKDGTVEHRPRAARRR